MEQTKTFFESSGLVLRKIANILWFFLPLILLIFTVLVSLIVPSSSPEYPPVEIVSDACYIESYYQSLNETSCSLEIEFNQTVYPDEITVTFYDKSGKKLATQNVELRGASYISYDTKAVNDYFIVKGNVDSYEIVDYSGIESAELDLYYRDIEEMATSLMVLWMLWLFFRSIYIIPIVLSVLFFSCKTYRINGHSVIVYAGRMQHYIKIDGQKHDEKNALISFTALTLSASTNEGDRIEVYISSFTKRISLRVNGVLQSPASF